ncbi:MAG: hypothetical protein FWG92_08510 [Leptospirales bacterium]|nr:hypothetical protein [Leptospirales bacterium]
MTAIETSGESSSHDWLQPYETRYTTLDGFKENALPDWIKKEKEALGSGMNFRLTEAKLKGKGVSIICRLWSDEHFSGAGLGVEISGLTNNAVLSNESILQSISDNTEYEIVKKTNNTKSMDESTCRLLLFR